MIAGGSLSISGVTMVKAAQGTLAPSLTWSSRVTISRTSGEDSYKLEGLALIACVPLVQ